MILFASLLAAATLQPAAGNWQALHGSTDFDPASLVRTAEVTRVTVRIRYPMSTQSVIVLEIRCARNELRYARLTETDHRGQVTRDDQGLDAFRTIAPDSRDAAYRDAFCPARP